MDGVHSPLSAADDDVLVRRCRKLPLLQPCLARSLSSVLRLQAMLKVLWISVCRVRVGSPADSCRPLSDCAGVASPCLTAAALISPSFAFSTYPLTVPSTAIPWKRIYSRVDVTHAALTPALGNAALLALSKSVWLENPGLVPPSPSIVILCGVRPLV